MTEEKKVYTVKQAAEVLEVSTKTIYSYIKAGNIKAAKLGKSYRITAEELNKVINQGIKTA